MYFMPRINRNLLILLFQAIAIAFLAGTAVQVTAESLPQNAPYKVGHEDVITISVTRHPEFSGDYFISTDGTLNLSAVGKISVSGKTLDEIATIVQNGLRNRLLNPEVTVTLKTPRMQRVYVLGVVDKPGLYDMKPGWRITEAVAAAGGLVAKTEPADCTVTILRSATGKRESVKLTEVFRGVANANAPVESGDVLTIETVEAMPVYVMGKVKNPGLYNLRKDSAGLLEAVTLAGGTTDDAALGHVTITHMNGTKKVVDIAPAIVDGKQDSDVNLQSGDLVMIPEETSRIAVLGSVTEPGFYTLRNGRKLVLSDALALAKGTNKNGKLGAIVIVRSEATKQQRLIFDLNKFLKSGDLTQNPEVKPGDVIYVPETSKPDWSSIFGALTSVGFLLK